MIAPRAWVSRNHLPTGAEAFRTIGTRHAARIFFQERPAQAHCAVKYFYDCGKATEQVGKGREKVPKKQSDLRFALLHNSNGLTGASAHDGVAGAAWIGAADATGELAAHKMDERFHLLLHVRHFVTHVEDHFDSGEVNAQVAGQRKDHLETLQVLVGVKARIALRARRRQKASAFVKAEGLRVKFVQLRNRTNHVTSLGLFSTFWRCFHFRLCRSGALQRRFRKDSLSRIFGSGFAEFT